MGKVVPLRQGEQAGFDQPDVEQNYASMLLVGSGILSPETVERLSSTDQAQAALALILTRDFYSDRTGNAVDPDQRNMAASLLGVGEIAVSMAGDPEQAAEQREQALEAVIGDIRVLRKRLGELTLGAALDERFAALRSAFETNQFGQRLSLVPLIEESAAESGVRAGMAGRRHAMLRNYGSFLDTVRSENPNDARGRRQQPVYEKIAEFFGREPEGDDPRGGLIHFAMSSGKGVIAAKTIAAVGIGQPVGAGEQPLSALWLAPKLSDLDEAKEKLSEYAPEVATGEDWSTDAAQPPVTRKTYKWLVSISDAEFERLCGGVDMVVGNEIHRALGPKLSARMRTLMQNKLVLGLTATDRFTDPEDEAETARSVRNILGLETIDQLSVPDSLDMNIANGVQLFAIASGRTLHIDSKRDTFTEKDLEPLLNDTERNQRIADVVCMLVELGRSGIVSCVWGADEEFHSVAHARRLARLVDGLRVVDAETQQIKTIRAAAIGGYQKRRKRKELWDKFNEGEIDVLFHSKYLTENVDSDKIEFVFEVAPRGSIVDVTQEFGRGGRLKDRLTICIQLIDTIFSGRNRGKLYTFFHVVGMPELSPIVQGTVIGRPGYTSHPGRSGKEYDDGRIEIRQFPMHLLEAVQEYNGVVLASLSVGFRKPPPKGWPPSTRAMLNEFGLTATSSLLHGLDAFPRGEDAEPPYFRRGGSIRGRAYYINPAALAWARKNEIFKRAEGEPVLLADIKRSRKISASKLDTVLGVLGISPDWAHFPSRTNRKLPFVTADENSRIEAFLDSEYVSYDPLKDVSVQDMAAALGRHRTRVNEHVTRSNKVLPDSQKRFFYNRHVAGAPKLSFCLTPPNARQVIDELGRGIPADAVILGDLPSRMNLEASEAADVPYLLKISPFRWNVVTQKIFAPENGIAWLSAEDAVNFAFWARGSRRARSTMGILEPVAGLNGSEFAELDGALFDLRRPSRLPRRLAAQVYGKALQRGGLHRLDGLERSTLEGLFVQGGNVMEVVTDLIGGERITAPAKPLVTNLPQYYARQLDNFLVGVLAKIKVRVN